MALVISYTAIVAAEQDIVAMAMSWHEALEKFRILKQGPDKDHACEAAIYFEDKLFEKCELLRKLQKLSCANKSK